MTKHTGLIKNDETPCGFNFSNWDCRKMIICRDEGQFDKCLALKEKIE